MDYPRNDALMSPSMASGVIHDAKKTFHTLRLDVQELVRAEDEVSSEVGAGDSRAACTRSVSPQPLVRVSFNSGNQTSLPSRLSSGFSYQLPRSSSSRSLTPGFIYTSQKTSINSPATSSSALTPASTYAPPASISSTPISLSQTPNALRCCGKTFRRPCDLRLTSLPISL